MRKKFIALAALGLSLLTFSAKAEDQASANNISGSFSTGIYNKYVFRGYELSDDSLVIQPSLTLNYKNFSVSLWGNIDTNQQETQTVKEPPRLGKKSFNEVDLTFSYTYTLNKLSITGGYIYYGTKYADETEEVFLSLSYDTILNPTLTVYRDISAYPGTYVNLSFSHSIPVYQKITADLSASFGYFKGDSKYWKTYERSTGGYTGKKYSALHDGKIQVSLTYPIQKNITLQPTVQYWFPLSSKARRTIDGNSYNPNGHLDNTFVAGVNFTLNW
jgi:hypothetical protein